MIKLSAYGIRVLKDVYENPGRFEFSQGSDGTWGITPYGKCTNPEECLEIGIALKELLDNGFIHEFVPNGGTFELTAAGINYVQKL